MTWRASHKAQIYCLQSVFLAYSIAWYFEEVAIHCATVSSMKSTHSAVTVTRLKVKTLEG